MAIDDLSIILHSDMAQILPFKKPRIKNVFRRRKRRNTFMAVPVWVSLIAAVAYFNFDGGQFVESPVGSARISATRKFTSCNWTSQRYCVVDGDTIRFAGAKIRVEDIDTPEIHDYKCESELERGLRAKSRLLELINEGPFDIVSNGGDDVDQYGRKLRHLMRNGLSLGELLIDEGLARRYVSGRRSWCL